MPDTRVYVIMRRGPNFARIVAYSKSFVQAREIAGKLTDTMIGTSPMGDVGYTVEEAHELFLRDLEV